MNFLYKLEKKFGKYAVNNLSLKIVICFTVSYALWLILPGFYQYLIFDTISVFGGHQYWRIFTWIFTIPGNISIFTFLMLFIYVSIGNSVEHAVGTFIYNVYIFGAYFFIAIAQFVTGLITYLKDPAYYDTIYNIISSSDETISQEMLGMLSDMGPTYLISVSVFLGFGLVFSDAMMLFFFIIPIKAGWFAIVDIAYLVFIFVKYDNLVMRGIIFAVLLNFFIFYMIVKKYSSYRRFHSTSEQMKRRKVYRQAVREQETAHATPEGITRHKCAVCGRSERDGDELEFRFCSKCNGNYEYCNEHLFTHQHVK